MCFHKIKSKFQVKSMSEIQEKLEIIDFSNNPQFFMNINTPEDLEKYKLEKIKNDN